MSDSPSLNVEYGNQPIGTVNFSESTSFVGVLPQVTRAVRVSVREDGKLREIISRDAEIEIDNFLTVVITGSLASPVLILIPEPPPDIAEDATTSELRIVNASNSLESALRFELSAANLGGINPLPILDRNGVSGNITVEAADDYRLQVFDTATDQLLWDSGIFNIVGASRALFVLLDHFGPAGNPVRMVSVSAEDIARFPGESLTSAIRLVNVVTDRSAVDFYIDGNRSASGVLFGDIGNYLNLSPGEHTLTITGPDDSEDILLESTFETASGEYQTIVGVGDAGSEYSALVSLDALRRVGTRAILAVSNVAPAGGTSDVYVLSPGGSVENTAPNISALGFPGNTTLQLVEGTYDLVLTQRASQEIIFGPMQISLDSGGLYRVYVTDSPGGGKPLQAILGDDFMPGFQP